MSLPYRWSPSGGSPQWKTPDVGALVGWDHAVWRVVEVREIPKVDWSDRDRRIAESRGAPWVVVIRPAALTGDDPTLRRHDIHLSCHRRTRWDVFPDEHYPVCAKCSEPLPCREQMADRMVSAATARMDRYSTEGVCPACEEPITSRQKTIVFDDNTEIPGGPPVAFHAGRGGCRAFAARYEEQWAAADPEHRRVTMSCPGWITNHGDGTYECSREHDCPGLQARHQSFRRCDCPGCHAGADFDCHPAADAVPRGYGVQQEPIPFPEGNPPS